MTGFVVMQLKFYLILGSYSVVYPKINIHPLSLIDVDQMHYISRMMYKDPDSLKIFFLENMCIQTGLKHSICLWYICCAIP